MTFEYIAPAGAMLHVDAATRRDGTPVAELSAADGGQFTTIQVPVDRVEEVVAGIRDAARTAGGQQPVPKPAYYGVNGCTCRAWTGEGGVPRFLRGDEGVELISGWKEQPDCPHHAPAVNGQKPKTTPCGSRSLPTYSGEVVRCVLDTGHAAQCQSAVEWPYVSWPNPSHREGWRTVGQPAEAQAADEAHPPHEQWRTESLDVDGWTASAMTYDDRQTAIDHLNHRRKLRPGVKFRLVRETTTWTVEDER